MAIEVFTTYTKNEDAGDTINVTSSKIDVVLMNRGSDSFVGKDLGVDHFGDYVHIFELFVEVGSGASPHCWVGVSDVLGDMSTWNNAFALLITVANGKPLLISEKIVSGVFTGGTADNNLTLDTLYYVKVTRTTSSCTWDIYSNTERTTLVASVTVTGGVTSAFRYNVPVASRNVAGNDWTGFIQNYDLQEGGGGTIFNQEINENLTLAEGFGTIPTSLFSESMAFSEILAVISNKIITENLTLTEALLVIDTTVLSENMTLLELLQVIDTKLLTDTQSLSEALITISTSLLSDTLSMSDVLESAIVQVVDQFFNIVRLNSHILTSKTLNSHIVTEVTLNSHID